MKPLPYTLDDQKVQANFDALATQGVNGADLVNGSVSTAKLADSLVSTAKIADSSVTSAKIADSAVTSAKIADGTITSTDLATSVVNGYLKLASAADRRIAFGTANTPNYDGTTVPTSGNVAHGLGTTPTVVVASASPIDNGSVQMPVTVSVDTKDATNIVFRFYAAGYTGLNYSIYYWIAIA